MAVAQTVADQTETDRDRSRIVAFLEDNLSGAGRTIRIENFTGLLSSQASLSRLTIADDQGVWLTLDDVELDWKRTSLLAGKLEVTSLSAGEINVLRKPDAGETSQSPEAKPFSLPELPVSIVIDEVNAPLVTLGADILGIGEPIDLSFLGGVNLADGQGSAQLEIQRLSGPSGAFLLDASYDNADTQLALDLSLTESKGGLITTLIGLPGAPDMALTAQGEGPLDTFIADITLATEGTPRLSGKLGLSTLEDDQQDQTAQDTPEPKTRVFSADIQGDVSPLFETDYAEFFGVSTALKVEGTSYPDGRLSLSPFSLKTNNLSLGGTIDIGTDSLPTSFDISGSIAAKGGKPTLLPLTGPKREIDRATLSAQYDVTQGEQWTAEANLLGFNQIGVSIQDVTIDANGTVSRSRNQTTSQLVRAVTAQIDMALNGLDVADTKLQTAIGDALSARTSLSWNDEVGFVIKDARFEAQDTVLQSSGTLSSIAEGLTFVGQANLRAPDVSRFAPLAGRPLKGAITAQIDGSYAILGGGFDAQASADTRNAAIGIPKIDALLGGQGTVTLDASRDETGINLRSFDVKSNALSAQASGALNSDTATLNLSAQLDDLARLDAGISGPAALRGTVKRREANAPWETETTLNGPGGSTAELSGTVAQNFNTASLRAIGSVPLGLANTFTTATLLQGDAAVDMQLVGPLELDSISGTITTQSGLRAVVPAAGLSFVFDPSTVTLSNSTARLNANATSDAGGRVTASGQIGLTGRMPADLNITLNRLTVADPDLYTTEATGALTINGPLLGSPRLEGRIALGRTDIQVAPTAFGSGGDIPEITHKNEPANVRQTRQRAGVLGDGSDGESSGTNRAIALDLTIDAPNQMFIRGRGLDAELGGSLRLRGSTRNIVPVGRFSLNRGRLSILGKRLDLEEGQLSLQGDFDPVFELVAVTDTDDLIINVITSGRVSAPKLTLTSAPDLPEDEIFAQLLFGRALSDISPLQAAQMAAAIATLTGGGNGIVGDIRDEIGLDDLDVTTSDEGDAALRLGKYLSDEIYTDVTIDSSGKSVINLNLDASDTVTFKGSASADGDTSLGVFFEKDY